MSLKLRVTGIEWDHIWLTLHLAFEGETDTITAELNSLDSLTQADLTAVLAGGGSSAAVEDDVLEMDADTTEGDIESELPGIASTEAEAEGVENVPQGWEVDSSEKTMLSITSILDGAAAFEFVDKKRVLPVEAIHRGGTNYDVVINITQFRKRSQFPDGTWRLYPRVDGLRGRAATFDMANAKMLDEFSRVFLYDRNNTSYTFSFGFSESEEPPALLMRVYQMFRRAKARKRLGPLKRLKNYPKKLRRRVTSRRNKNKALNWFYWTVRNHRPAGNPRILFASEQRPAIGGNLLRVRDRMAERGLDREFDFSESFRVPSTSTKLSTLRAIYLLARADFVFIDDYFAMFDSLKLDKKCTIVQLWHAGSGFKAVGYSRFGRYGSPKLQNAHRNYTYAITGSKNLVPVYAEVFGIEESAVIPTGLPRIDEFLDEERVSTARERFFREYPDLDGKKVILFAPTFRGRGIRDGRYDFDKIDFKALNEFCGDDTVVLFRMHHFVRAEVPIPAEYSSRLRDFSHYPDGNELLHMSDILITDYSSIIYEFSLLERPMLFFAYDKDTYETTRGFHRDYVETAPGKVCTTFPALMNALYSEDYESWRRDAFVEENFDHIDTGSADRVIDWIIRGEWPDSDADELEGILELGGVR